MLTRRLGERLVGEGEGQSYIGLELGGVVVLAVGLIAPIADGFGGGGGQDRVSAEGAEVGDGAVFGDLDFEDDRAGAVGGQSFGGIQGLGAAEEAGFGLRGSEPDGLGWGDLRCWGDLRWGDLRWGDPSRRRCFYDGIAVLPGGIGVGWLMVRSVGLGGNGLHAKDDFAFFVDD